MRTHTQHGRRFSETLHAIRERAQQGPTTVGELFELCGPQGHSFLAIFFMLPFMQPIPLPGISTALGLIVALLGIFVALDRPPWVPRRLANMPIEGKVVLRLCRALEKLLGRLERLIRPRATVLSTSPTARIVNCAVWVIHALLLSLPLPIPLSNTLPAVVVLLMAIGSLEDDGLVIALAYVGTAVNVAFFTGLVAIPMLGWKLFTN